MLFRSAKGLEEKTFMPTTERMNEILPPVVPPGAPDQKLREHTADIAGKFGEFNPIMGLPEATSMLIKGGKTMAPAAAEMVLNVAEKAGTPVRGLRIVEDTSYRGSHTAPRRGQDVAAPGYDLTGGGSVYPDDVYSANGIRYYGSGSAIDKSAFSIIN